MSADLWIESAAPQLTGCPLVTMRNEWLNAAREFFSRSTCWRVDLEQVPVVDGQAEYTFVSPVVDASINYIHQIAIPSRILVPASQTPKVLADQSGETPTQYANPVNPETVTLWPSPTKDIDPGMVTTVSLVPLAVDTVLPDYLTTQYFEVLLDGVLGRVMNYKNKPYTSQDGADYHLRRFRSGMSRVRANTLHGLNQSQNTWFFPQGFANGRF